MMENAPEGPNVDSPNTAILLFICRVLVNKVTKVPQIVHNFLVSCLDYGHSNKYVFYLAEEKM